MQIDLNSNKIFKTNIYLKCETRGKKEKDRERETFCVCVGK